MNTDEFLDSFDAAAEEIYRLRAENSRLKAALATGIEGLEHHGLSLTAHHKIMKDELQKQGTAKPTPPSNIEWDPLTGRESPVPEQGTNRKVSNEKPHNHAKES